MAVASVDFYSETLKREVSFKAIIPLEYGPGPYPTIYLLHGLQENNSAWLYNTRIRIWAEEYGLAVIMPNGENSFYLQAGDPESAYGDFGEYIGYELVKVSRELFPLSHKRDETFIGGLSMGGYGTMRNALKYHDTFGKAAVLSGALHWFEEPREWVYREGNIKGELAAFGDLDEAEKTDKNPRVLIEEIKEKNAEDGQNHFPDFFICCGTEDHLLNANHQLADALKEAGADVVFESGPGEHEWDF